ncbi:MAG: hypothetical protein VR65_22590 [Desulfobulbaceae bacterium BRH_c16a]|nr:MAG: hypothetical protein VR65_22590 [Desulfobulbaceae bacterium BRH_c16a]
MAVEEQSNTTSPSLTSLVLKGGAWMLAARLICRGFGVLATIILARLLSPAEFGLVAVGMLSVSLLKVFTEVGILQALIKESSENTSKFLDTAWTVEALRGTVIFLLVFYSAPWIAAFFNAMEAVGVIRALAVVPFLHGLTSIRIIYLQKELNFRKQFFYEVSASLAPVLVSIPLAFLLKNVWAIVIGTISAEIVRLIVSYCLMPYIPRIRFDFSHFLRLFRFGKWIFLGSIISYFAMELDTFYAARLLDTKTLGIYVLAFGLTNTPVIEVAKSLGKVFFPAFAKISHDPARVRSAFIKSTSVLYLLIVPISISVYMVSEDFVIVFLGEEWFEMISVMQVLALAALTRGLGVPTGSLFNGLGKPKLSFYNNLIRLIALAVFLNMVVFWLLTPVWIGVAVLAANSALLMQFIYQTVRYTNINLADWSFMILPLIAAAIIMVISVITLSYYVRPGFIRLLLILVTGACSYLTTLFVLNKFFKLGILDIYYSLLKPNLKSNFFGMQ